MKNAGVIFPQEIIDIYENSNSDENAEESEEDTEATEPTENANEEE